MISGVPCSRTFLARSTDARPTFNADAASGIVVRDTSIEVSPLFFWPCFNFARLAAIIALWLSVGTSARPDAFGLKRSEGFMPRFYFDLDDAEFTILDEEGGVYADRKQAMAAASRTMGMMAAEAPAIGERTMRIHVRDDAGRLIYRSELTVRGEEL
jgi:hypothetical protein